MRALVPNTAAARAGDLVFFGGTIGTDENGTLVAPNDVPKQTESILRRFESVLIGQESSLVDIISVVVYLPSLEFYDSMNQVYVRIMPKPLPTRKVIVTPLVVEGAVVEMTATAALSGWQPI